MFWCKTYMNKWVKDLNCKALLHWWIGKWWREYLLAVLNVREAGEVIASAATWPMWYSEIGWGSWGGSGDRSNTRGWGGTQCVRGQEGHAGHHSLVWLHIRINVKSKHSNHREIIKGAARLALMDDETAVGWFIQCERSNVGKVCVKTYFSQWSTWEDWNVLRVSDTRIKLREEMKRICKADYEKKSNFHTRTCDYKSELS